MAQWDPDIFEPGFWDYSGAGAGWQVNVVDLGDPALSMGTVEYDERFSWTVKDHTGREVKSGAADTLSRATQDAEMAYAFSSDPDLALLSTRRQAANISRSDLVDHGGDWFMYEPTDASLPQLNVQAEDSDEWEIDVAWSDGRFEDTVIVCDNIPDALDQAVEFYNRVALRRTAADEDNTYSPTAMPPQEWDGPTAVVNDASEDNDPDFERNARRRTASLSMWDSIESAVHTVAGWDFDSALEGYVANGPSAHFACKCGANVEAPGYTTCACGTIWNSYPITSEGSTRVLCREVPNRGADVILANRRTASKRTAETMRGGRSTAEVAYYNGDRSAVGRFVTITDPQGKNHNPSCTSAAFGAFEDNAADEGFSTGWDICESWGMPANDESVLAVVGDWLESGTTECKCSDYDDIYGDRYSRTAGMNPEQVFERISDVILANRRTAGMNRVAGTALEQAQEVAAANGWQVEKHPHGRMEWIFTRGQWVIEAKFSSSGSVASGSVRRSNEWGAHRKNSLPYKGSKPVLMTWLKVPEGDESLWTHDASRTAGATYGEPWLPEPEGVGWREEDPDFLHYHDLTLEDLPNLDDDRHQQFVNEWKRERTPREDWGDELR